MVVKTIAGIVVSGTIFIAGYVCGAYRHSADATSAKSEIEGVNKVYSYVQKRVADFSKDMDNYSSLEKRIGELEKKMQKSGGKE